MLLARLCLLAFVGCKMFLLVVVVMMLGSDRSHLSAAGTWAVMTGYYSTVSRLLSSVSCWMSVHSSHQIPKL